MLHNFHQTWSIVEEHAFADELAALMSDPIKADEFLEGAKFTLSRKPRSGTQIGENVWFLPMTLSTLALFYKFDEECVYLLSIRNFATDTP